MVREGGRIIIIYGTIMITHSESFPKKIGVNVKNVEHIVMGWEHRKYGCLSIIVISIDGKRGFFVNDPRDVNNNLLEEIPGAC